MHLSHVARVIKTGEKGNMNLNGRQTTSEADITNVLSFFGGINLDVAPIDDPLDVLLREAQLEYVPMNEVKASCARTVVTESQIPDQSIYVLEKQLSNLRGSLSRIKFYLGDLEDLIPR